MAEREQWKDAIRRGVADVRARWPQPIGSASLADAHRLLDDAAIRNAVIEATIEYGYSLTGVIGAARDDAGKFIVPFPERIWPYLSRQIYKALCDGRFSASGIDPDNVARAKPFGIPAERWSILEPDFEHSTATCKGKTVAIGITIEIVAAAQPADVPRPNPPKSTDIDGWFVIYKQACDARGERPTEPMTMAAAKEKFGDRVRRKQIREIRKKLAPDWLPSKPGPKDPRNSAK